MSTYTGQRGHTVPLISADETYTCGTCRGTVMRVAAEPWERAKLRLPAWVHDTGRLDHTAAPAVAVLQVWRSGLVSQHAVKVQAGDGAYTATISTGRVSWADGHVWADPAAYGLERVYCPGHGGGVCQYGACDYIRPAGLDLAGMAAAFEATERDQRAAQSAARLARYARSQVGYRLLG